MKNNKIELKKLANKFEQFQLEEVNKFYIMLSKDLNGLLEEFFNEFKSVEDLKEAKTQFLIFSKNQNIDDFFNSFSEYQKQTFMKSEIYMKWLSDINAFKELRKYYKNRIDYEFYENKIDDLYGDEFLNGLGKLHLKVIEGFVKKYKLNEDDFIELINYIKSDNEIFTHKQKVYNVILNNFLEKRQLDIYEPSYSLDDGMFYDINDKDDFIDLNDGICLPIYNMNLNFDSYDIDKVELMRPDIFISPYRVDLDGDKKKKFSIHQKITNLSTIFFENDYIEKAILVFDISYLESAFSRDFRLFLSENNLVESIHFFPKGYFFKSDNQFSILLLSKNKSENVSLFDLNYLENYLNDEKIKTNIYDDKSILDILKNETSNKIVNKLPRKSFNKYLIEFEKLKFNKYKNINQENLVQLSKFISLDESYLENGCQLEGNYVKAVPQFNLNSIYFNTTLIEANEDNLCIPLLDNRLYINLDGISLAPKLYKKLGAEKFIEALYYPFNFKKNKGINNHYLLEQIRNIDYERFYDNIDFKISKENFQDTYYKPLGNLLSKLYVICPSLETQQELALNTQEKYLEEIENKNISLKDNELQNENDVLLVRWLRHNLETSLGELSNLPDELKDIYVTIKNKTLLNEVDFSREDIDNVKYHIDKIKRDLNSFYSQSIIDLKMTDENLIDIVDNFQNSIKEDGFSIEVDKKSIVNSSKISCDKNLINDVLAYLLNNAKQHAFKGENNKILIQLTYESNKIVLSFLNTGAPFNKAINLKEFITLDKTTKFKSGGFGGYQVYRIIRKHNAELRLIKLSDEYSSQNYVTKIDLVFNIKFTK